MDDSKLTQRAMKIKYDYRVKEKVSFKNLGKKLYQFDRQQIA